MKSFFSYLENRVIETNSLLCIGLDPHQSDLPENTKAAVLEFCKSIIQETADLAAAFKPNAAFFEVLGPDGITVLKEVITMIPDGIPVILDAKRGDISSTAQAYAQSVFKTIGADAITINPYLGRDSIEPFIKDPQKGAFMLCKTSNPGSSDLQDLYVVTEEYRLTKDEPKPQSKPLYIHVAQLAQKLSVNNNLGNVVGATQPESLLRIREAAPELWILAPGVGAQGGDLQQTLHSGLRKDGYGILIPVSRGISRSNNPRQAAESIINMINQERSSIRYTPGVERKPVFTKSQEKLASGLLDAGCVKFGSFTLKSGTVSPIYIDLRRLVGFPELLSQVATAYVEILMKLKFDHIGALPYAALPIASSISLHAGWSMIYPRKETKQYGTKAQIEGVYDRGQKVVIIDDLISTGGSKFEGIQKLETAGLVIEDVVVLLDRSRDGKSVLKNKGYLLHAVMSISDLLTYYDKNGMVEKERITEAKAFLNL